MSRNEHTFLGDEAQAGPTDAATPAHRVLFRAATTLLASHEASARTLSLALRARFRAIYRAKVWAGLGTVLGADFRSVLRVVLRGRSLSKSLLPTVSPSTKKKHALALRPFSGRGHRAHSTATYWWWLSLHPSTLPGVLRLAWYSISSQCGQASNFTISITFT